MVISRDRYLSHEGHERMDCALCLALAPCVWVSVRHYSMATAEFQYYSGSLESQASAIEGWQIGINGCDFRISSQKPRWNNDAAAIGKIRISRREGNKSGRCPTILIGFMILQHQHRGASVPSFPPTTKYGVRISENAGATAGLVTLGPPFVSHAGFNWVD